MTTAKTRKILSEKNLRHSRPRIGRLYRQFVALVRASPHNMSDVARMSGIHHETIYLWGNRTEPNVASFQAALRVIGYRLEIVPIQEPKP
jgi:DNA-binding phage protein